tara:strand:+ start:264 stop:710 length:447 start_codon:yes stop_codon:yes gene_type:complete
MNLLNTVYDWLVAFHIISVIALMAGMLYLPRLYVRNAMAKEDSSEYDTFIIMEQKLIKIIINPSFFATVIFGVMLLFVPGLVDFTKFWIWIKLFSFVVMFGLYVFFLNCFKHFKARKNTKSPKLFRYLNEIPTVLMVIIVIMVVVKPF